MWGKEFEKLGAAWMAAYAACPQCALAQRSYKFVSTDTFLCETTVLFLQNKFLFIPLHDSFHA